METKQENVIPTDYAEVMQKSYIDYAMSVIISRALPDVRDGLKPVQRRTLYDMYELGIRYDRPYRKCAAPGGCLPKRWGRGCGALTRMRRWSRGRWTEQTKSPPVQRTPTSLQGDSFEPLSPEV